eukprot:790950_1
MTFETESWDLSYLSEDEGSWAHLIADDKFVLRKFYDEQDCRSFLPDEDNIETNREFSLDCEEHAGIVDFKSETDARNEALARWREQLRCFRLEDSSFGSLFDKRLAVVRYLFRENSGKIPKTRPKQFVHTSMFQRGMCITPPPSNVKSLIPGDLSAPGSLVRLSENLKSAVHLALRKEKRTKLNECFRVLVDQTRMNSQQSLGSVATLLNFGLRVGSPQFIFPAVQSLLEVYSSDDSKSSFDSDQVSVALGQLADFQKECDLSIPWPKALKDSFREPPKRTNGSRSTSMAGLACDGKYLYIHGSRGLSKMGTGYGGTLRGREYA